MRGCRRGGCPWKRRAGLELGLEEDGNREPQRCGNRGRRGGHYRGNSGVGQEVGLRGRRLLARGAWWWWCWTRAGLIWRLGSETKPETRGLVGSTGRPPATAPMAGVVEGGGERARGTAAR